MTIAPADLLSQPALILGLIGVQGLWALFLVFLSFSIKRVLRDIESNTQATSDLAKSVANINLLLSGNYITKADHERLEERIRDTEAKVVQLHTIMTIRGLSGGSGGED